MEIRVKIQGKIFWDNERGGYVFLGKVFLPADKEGYIPSIIQHEHIQFFTCHLFDVWGDLQETDTEKVRFEEVLLELKNAYTIAQAEEQLLGAINREIEELKELKTSREQTKDIMLEFVI